MQTNFASFNDDVKTMDFNGLTLVWSPDDQRFMLPMPEPEKAGIKYLFDEPTKSFVQVLVNNPDFFYRDRKATAPDGTVLQERILIGKNKQGEVVEIPDPEFQSTLVRAELLNLQMSAVKMVQIWLPFFLVGVCITLVAFFWNLAGSAAIVAESFAVGSMEAMKQIGYCLAWGTAVVVAGAFAWYVLPLMFRAGASSTPTTKRAEATGSPKDQHTTTNIVVNHIQGSEGGAQAFINNREML